MERFSDFAVIAGGAAAALIGLLFVAVAIRAAEIGRSVELRSRIAGILTVFLTVLVSWLGVALPDPGPQALGVELLVVAAVAGSAFIVLEVRAQKATHGAPLARVLDRLSLNIVTTVFVALAGLALLLGSEMGLFLLAFGTVVAFVGGVTGAWLVLVLLEPRERWTAATGVRRSGAGRCRRGGRRRSRGALRAADGSAPRSHPASVR